MMVKYVLKPHVQDAPERVPTKIRTAIHRQLNPPLAGAPAFRKDVTPLNRTPGGLMEQSNASLQRGDQG